MRGSTKTASKSRGYTIVEIMIFLAVSGFMFFLAANFINGKQATAEFRQGMNAINVQVQAVINDVSNGYYPSNNSFSCNNPPSPGNLIFTPAPVDNTKQGSNKGCVFFGKVMQFGVSGTEGLGYNIYTVAGAQYASPGKAPTSFTNAKPTAIDVPGPGGVNLTDKKTLEWGLQVTKVYNDVGSPGSNPDLSSVGFFNSFNSYDNSGLLTSGSQTVDVLAIPADPPNPITPTGGGDTEPRQVVKINTTLNDLYKLNNPHIIICLQGGSNKYGTLTIGGTNSQRVTTTMHITSDREGDCPA